MKQTSTPQPQHQLQQRQLIVLHDMTDIHKSEETVGECGVCSNSLPVGANHAYTVCGHLFCISCLLKWHKTNPKATCPMCRAPLHDDDAVTESAAIAAAQAGAEEAEAFEFSYQEEQARSRITLEEMDLSQHEQSMHDYMMLLVDDHAAQYCRANPTCTYMGVTNLHTIRNREYDDYIRIEVGTQSVNCHYVIELRDSSRAFRYKFGRIEDIRRMHPIFEGISWFVFRELIDRWDNDTGYMQTVWSNETQLIAAQGGAVKSLRQYVPRVRMSV